MIKIGAITVGQAPRPDITQDILEALGDGFQVIEAGVLDGLTREEILRDLAPEPGKDVMPTKLQDGKTIDFAEYHAFPRIQQCIEKLEAQGVSLIYMYCLSSFPPMKTKVPLIYPRDMTRGIVQSLLVRSSMIELMPSPDILEQQQRFWGQYVQNVTYMVAEPFGEKIFEQLDEVIEQANHSDAELILMDCMGYTSEQMRYLKKRTHKFVMFPRTMVAAIIRELLH